MRDIDQVMKKMRVRRLLEELLDSELLQVELEEDNESQPAQGRQPIKRISLVARYIPGLSS